MNIENLKAFHKVAERGNFTQVARELFLTQPAVSMQIQNLEQSLGVVLFKRTCRNVRLTSEGHVLYKYTQQIFGVLDELRNAFQELGELQTGELTIGATAIMGAYWLPFFINSFHHRYPRIKIRMVICNSHNLAGKLQSGELEIGFGGSSSGHPNLVQHFLHREPLILVAGKNLAPIGSHKVLQAEDIVCETIIMREQGARMTEKVTKWLKTRAPRATPPTVVTVDNMEVTKQMVINGVGITALPRHAATRELESGDLVPLPVKDFSMHTNYFLVALPGAAFSRTTKAFLATLFEHGVPISEEMLQ